MSIIQCPECNKEISDTLNTCIHCGFKLHTEQGKVIIHGYTGFYIVNPTVKIYDGENLIAELGKGKTFEYSINKQTTLTFKCSIRSTEVTVNPNVTTEIQLNFNNTTGELKCMCNEHKSNDTTSNVIKQEKYKILNNKTVNNEEEISSKIKEGNNTENTKRANIIISIVTVLMIIIIGGFIIIPKLTNNKTSIYTAETNTGSYRTVEIRVKQLDIAINRLQSKGLYVGKYVGIIFNGNETSFYYVAVWDNYSDYYSIYSIRASDGLYQEHINYRQKYHKSLGAKFSIKSAISTIAAGKSYGIIEYN